MFNENKQKFGFRKLSIGLASVLIGVSFISTNKIVKADTISESSQQDTLKQASDHDGNKIAVQLSGNNTADTKGTANPHTQILQKVVHPSVASSTREQIRSNTNKQIIGSVSANNATSVTKNRLRNVVTLQPNKVVQSNDLHTDANSFVPNKSIRSNFLLDSKVPSSSNESSELDTNDEFALNPKYELHEHENVNRNGGYDENYWGKIDVSQFTVQKDNDLLEITDFNNKKAHTSADYGRVIIPNVADFKQVGLDQNAKDIEITSDVLKKIAGISSEIGISKTQNKQIIAKNADWSKTFNQTGIIRTDLHNLNTSNITNTSYLFANNPTLSTTGDLSNWDLSNDTDGRSMFYQTTGLKALNISNWDMRKVKTDALSNFTGNDINLTVIANNIQLPSWYDNQSTKSGMWNNHMAVITNNKTLLDSKGYTDDIIVDGKQETRSIFYDSTDMPQPNNAVSVIEQVNQSLSDQFTAKNSNFGLALDSSIDQNDSIQLANVKMVVDPLHLAEDISVSFYGHNDIDGLDAPLTPYKLHLALNDNGDLVLSHPNDTVVNYQLKKTGTITENGRTYDDYHLDIINPDTGKKITGTDNFNYYGWGIASLPFNVQDPYKGAYVDVKVEVLSNKKSIVLGNANSLVFAFAENVELRDVAYTYKGIVHFVDENTGQKIANDVARTYTGHLTQYVFVGSGMPAYPDASSKVTSFNGVKQSNPLQIDSIKIDHFRFDKSDMPLDSDNTTYVLFNGITPQTPTSKVFEGTFYFKRISSQVSYTFVDNDNSGKTISAKTVTGGAGLTVNTGLTVPDGYLAVDSIPTTVEMPDTDANVILHFKHKIDNVTENSNATRKFILHLPSGSTKTIIQTIGLIRIHDYDEVLKKILSETNWTIDKKSSFVTIDGAIDKSYNSYDSNKQGIYFAPVTLPKVAGYRPVLRKNAINPAMFVISFVALPSNKISSRENTLPTQTKASQVISLNKNKSFNKMKTVLPNIDVLLPLLKADQKQFHVIDSSNDDLVFVYIPKNNDYLFNVKFINGKYLVTVKNKKGRIKQYHIKNYASLLKLVRSITH